MRQKTLRVFFLYAFLLAISVSLGLVFQKNNFGNGVLFLYVVYNVLKLVCFVYIIASPLKTYSLRKIIYVSSVIVSILGLVSLFNKAAVNVFLSLNNLLLIVLCISFLIEKIKFVSKVSYSRTISFWLVIGILFFSIGHMFFYLLRGNKEFLQDRLTISSIVTIVKNSIFCFGIIYGLSPSRQDNEIIDFDDSLKLDDLPESYNKPL
jgi:hypothetical protein